MRFIKISRIVALLTMMTWEGIVLGTPDPGQWLREILIGSDQSNYYTFEVTLSQPGSYYKKHKLTEFVVRDKRNGRSIRRIPVADVELSLDEEHPEDGMWTAVRKPINQIDLNGYIRNKDLEWLFPEDAESIEGYKVTTDGLLLNATKDRGHKLVHYKFKPERLFTDGFETDPSVVSIYFDNDNLYILAERGISAIDTIFVREVLVVDKNELK